MRVKCRECTKKSVPVFKQLSRSQVMYPFLNSEVSVLPTPKSHISMVGSCMVKSCMSGAADFFATPKLESDSICSLLFWFLNSCIDFRSTNHTSGQLSCRTDAMVVRLLVLGCDRTQRPLKEESPKYPNGIQYLTLTSRTLILTRI